MYDPETKLGATIRSAIYDWVERHDPTGTNKLTKKRGFGLGIAIEREVRVMLSLLHTDEVTEANAENARLQTKVAYYERHLGEPEHAVRIENQKLYEVIAYLLSTEDGGSERAEITRLDLTNLKVGLSVTEDSETGTITLNLTNDAPE